MNKITLFLLLCMTTGLTAQVDQHSELFRTLAIRDSLLFSVGFNTCDISQFEKLVSDDFEFYHDQSGVLASKAMFIENTRNGLCKMDYRAIRELVAGSLQVYPLKNQGALYGAIQTGEHRFYARRPGQADQLTSVARFTHLWLLQDGEWKLGRVLSYNHQ